ncbi:excinuclease ATPase subunit [Beggiatoa sp. PS]|nr:excinuclease ATPase subunit [Beggiatoa sp. PS]
MSVDKQQGFIFRSTMTGKQIPTTGLSSGEQHELVLFYELLFKTQDNALILIDEPEISLHISWLNKFIEDLKKVIERGKMDILIATHSPDIIGNHWDLTVELEGIKQID